MAGKQNKAKKTVRRKATVNACVPSWSDAQYWGFIRSGLRAKWNRYPLKWEVLRNAARQAVITARGRKSEYQCAKCYKWWSAKEVTVDHVIPCGSLKSYDDLPAFVERLFCPIGNLQVLCMECHKEKTKADREALKE
jgi:5-methylcytosine-specific restriction endonuclease McrA